MNQEQFWSAYSDLPPAAQNMVAEFVRFLRAKYQFAAEIPENGHALEIHHAGYYLAQQAENASLSISAVTQMELIVWVI